MHSNVAYFLCNLLKLGSASSVNVWCVEIHLNTSFFRSESWSSTDVFLRKLVKGHL